MGCISGKEKPPVDLDPINITLEHFDKLRVIGKGAFGKVHAVQRRDTKKLFAMKCLDKRTIVRQKMVKNVLSERKILANINYPLIVNLQFSMSTPTDLFMIVDLMQGGDLRYHLKHEKKFSEERVKFYTAQIALSLNYLHKFGLIHRDIKPDNILFDKSGNCHLTDFNLSVKIPEGGIRGTAGTRPYMAPEILKKTRYGVAADWWSLGVMVYEMICGRLPFTGDNETLKRAICTRHPQLPKTISEHASSVLKGLLEKNPEKRFTFDDLKVHPFFEGLSWPALEDKIADAPWKPDPNRANVDGSYDLDEQFEGKKKDKTPLPPEEEKLFAGWDYNPILQKEKPEIPSPGDEEEQNSSSDSFGDLLDNSSTDKGKEKKANEGEKEEKNVTKPKAHLKTDPEETKGGRPQKVRKRKSRKEMDAEGKGDEKRHDQHDKSKQIEDKLNDSTQDDSKGIKEHKRSKKTIRAKFWKAPC